jgi:hypothetical protein
MFLQTSAFAAAPGIKDFAFGVEFRPWLPFDCGSAALGRCVSARLSLGGGAAVIAAMKISILNFRF